MIDIENQIFDNISKVVRTHYPEIYMTGEYVNVPSSFPSVSLVQKSNPTYKRTQTSDSNENHVDVMFEVNIYSNKKTGKKAECKDIARIIDNQFLQLGFDRTMLEPVDNVNDSTIYRIVGRYVAIVSKEEVIYRR